MIMIVNKIMMTIAVARDPYHDHHLDRNRVANHNLDRRPDRNRTEEQK